MAESSMAVVISNRPAWKKTPEGWIKEKDHCPSTCPPPGPSCEGSTSCIEASKAGPSVSKPTQDSYAMNSDCVSLHINNRKDLEISGDQLKTEIEPMANINVCEIKKKILQKFSAMSRREPSSQPARKKMKVEETDKRAISDKSVLHLIGSFQSSQESTTPDTALHGNLQFLQTAGTCNEYVKRGTMWIKKRYSSNHYDEEFQFLSGEERLLKIASYEEMMRHKELGKCSQPHVIITKGITKEQKVVISTAEALTRLDLTGAAKDTRRFNYVCKLLEHFITNKLSSMSGTAQKMLFNGLEEVLNQVISTKNNIHIMKDLLKEARNALKQSQYDHVGSSSLWARHLETVDRLQNTLNSYEIEQREEDGKVKISDLPDECIHQILYRLTDHRDLVNAGLTESRTFDLSEANILWRQLCLFHFTNKQWCAVLKKGENMETFGWKNLYTKLVRRYGQRDVYSEMLHLCRHCNALFWNLHGHPCLVPDMKPESIPISPEMCVVLFTA